MRGNAISFWMRARISFPGFFLRFFIDSFAAAVVPPHILLMIQTIKQMTNSVPSSPYPNMVPPSSIQPLFQG